MYLRHCDGQSVSLPDLLQTGGAAGLDIVSGDAHRLDIRISLPPVAAPRRARIALQPMIEKPVGRQIVIQPDNIGRTGEFGQIVENPLGDLSANKCLIPGVMRIEPPA